MSSLLHRSDSPIFLTWIAHRRTRELARRLDLQLVELLSSHCGMRRYLELLSRTTRYLLSTNPSTVVVQSPSLVLTAYVLALKPLLGYRTLVDAHNEGVKPYVNKSRLVAALTRWTHRWADHVIVTNENLAAKVRDNGGRAIVLPDPVPTPPPFTATRDPSRFQIAVVATFADDEPIDEILKSATLVGEEYHFCITGNSAKLAASTLAALPSNVTLTGFLSENDYWALLASSDVVMDLTTMDDCLVCGAYEAIAVGTPLILSDNPPSKDWFGEIAEFTGNSADSIRNCLLRARKRMPIHVSAMPAATQRFESRWRMHAEQMRICLDQTC